MLVVLVATRDPLRNLLNTVAPTDRQIKAALRAAAKEAESMLADAAPTRRLQLELARNQIAMWLEINGHIRDGVGDAFTSSTQYQALVDNALFRAAGVDVAQWYGSMSATAERGLANYLARAHDGYTLSQRVYRQAALANGTIDKIINNALLLGKSPKELARDVAKFISPSTPGGASYAALRLGRTEVVNAYHRSSILRYQETPWVERAQWSLSGTHPRPDTCNDIAESGDFRQAGVYRVNNIPDKPHPQCLCYITPIPVDLDKFARDYKAGKYDSYIDGVLGNAAAA